MERRIKNRLLVQNAMIFSGMPNTFERKAVATINPVSLSKIRQIFCTVFAGVS